MVRPHPGDALPPFPLPQADSSSLARDHRTSPLTAEPLAHANRAGPHLACIPSRSTSCTAESHGRRTNRSESYTLVLCILPLGSATIILITRCLPLYVHRAAGGAPRLFPAPQAVQVVGPHLHHLAPLRKQSEAEERREGRSQVHCVNVRSGSKAMIPLSNLYLMNSITNSFARRERGASPESISIPPINSVNHCFAASRARGYVYQSFFDCN